jgi:hypothetical protein
VIAPEKAAVYKERIAEELREFSTISLYLAANFVILSTFKSLILIQSGVNDFVHGYIVALVEAVALGKIVLICQKIPFLNKTINQRPLIVSALAKAGFLAVVVFLGGRLEEKLFAHKVAEAALKQRLIVDVTHILCLLVVFFLMFVFRELSAALGPGKLKNLLLKSRELEQSH